MPCTCGHTIEEHRDDPEDPDWPGACNECPETGDICIVYQEDVGDEDEDDEDDEDEEDEEDDDEEADDEEPPKG